jgi:hypothetical protein
MRFKLLLLLLLVGLCPVISTIASAAEPPEAITEGHPALAAIWDAYQSGEITDAQVYLYRLYLLLDPQKLPAEFQLEGPPLKCGTTIFGEILRHAPEVPAVREEIEQYRSRSGRRDCTIETTHFCVHLGGSANMAYADSISRYCEESWQKYHVDMLWDAPPQCGTNGKIDVYIEPLGGGTLGLTEPIGPGPGPEPWDQCAQFHVDDQIFSWCTLKCTVAHEYMHVVQMGYVDSAAWFMENCAMMGEEWTYDSCNDYIGYLQSCIGRPYKSMYTHDGQYEYGNIVWPMYLTERFGIDIVRQIWNDFQYSGNIWNSINTILAPYGYDYLKAVMEYDRWLYYTRWRANAQHYSEGQRWLAYRYPDQSFNTFPTGNHNPNVNMKPEPLGVSIQRFIAPSGADNAVEATVNGPNCTLGVQLIANHGGQSDVREYIMSINSNGDGLDTIPDFLTPQDSVMMMVTMNRTCTGGGQDFVFSGRIIHLATDAVPQTQPLASNAEFAPAWPNPASHEAHLSYSLPRECGVDIKIVAADGRIVRSLLDARQPAGSHEAVWDGRDDSGRQLSRGLYWARIRAGSENLSQKIVRLY